MPRDLPVGNGKLLVNSKSLPPFHDQSAAVQEHLSRRVGLGGVPCQRISRASPRISLPDVPLISCPIRTSAAACMDAVE